MVSGHCGMILDHGRVVWVPLSGQEDSCNLFESWAAIRETPGAEHRLPGQIVGKWFWERNFLKSENLCQSRFGLIGRSLQPGNPLGRVMKTLFRIGKVLGAQLSVLSSMMTLEPFSASLYRYSVGRTEQALASAFHG